MQDYSGLENSELINLLHQRDAHIAQVETTLGNQVLELASKQQEIVGLQNQLSIQTQIADALTAQATQTQEELNTLNNEVGAKTAQIATLENEATAMEAQIQTLTSDLAEAIALQETEPTAANTITRINALELGDVSDLSVKLRTTSEGIKAYVALLYGVTN
jgi:chromosome segregation ATPase